MSAKEVSNCCSCFRNPHNDTTVRVIKWAAMAIGVILAVSALIAHFQGMGVVGVVSLATAGGVLFIGGLLCHFLCSKKSDPARREDVPPPQNPPLASASVDSEQSSTPSSSASSTPSLGRSPSSERSLAPLPFGSENQDPSSGQSSLPPPTSPSPQRVDSPEPEESAPLHQLSISTPPLHQLTTPFRELDINEQRRRFPTFTRPLNPIASFSSQSATDGSGNYINQMSRTVDTPTHHEHQAALQIHQEVHSGGLHVSNHSEVAQQVISSENASGSAFYSHLVIHQQSSIVSTGAHFSNVRPALPDLSVLPSLALPDSNVTPPLRALMPPNEDDDGDVSDNSIDTEITTRGGQSQIEADDSDSE